ncbi:oxygen-dependent choline dehydrogenase-like [Mytilus trossulus]|uniref:oxygen-dependent choline dehydrogenase-like n=1 Tax=Mytilus trossulus TaxID=6551 RepID=UPI003006B723
MLYCQLHVGAGSAGSIVATRLSEDGANVLLLEAGGTDLVDERTQIPLMWFFLKGTATDWGYWTVPQKFSHRAMKNEVAMQKKLLGTRKDDWGFIGNECYGFVRGSRFDFEQWEREGATGWGYDKVLPYFKKLENAKLTDYGNCVTEFAFDVLHAVITENYKTINEGICVTQSNIKNGTRCNSGNCYLRPALERQNLQVSLRSHVTKILFRKNKAVGVEFVKDNKTIRVFAKKEVILSAGVIGSAQILLLSGIGPTEHLRQMNINVKSNLPVGKNMQDHLEFFLQYNINMSLNTNSGNFATPRRILNYVFNKKGIFSGSGGDVNVFTHTCRKMNEGPNIQLSIIPTAYEKGAVEDPFLDLKKEVVKEPLKRVNSNSFQVILYILKPKSIRFTRRLEKTNAWKSINATNIRHDTPNHCSEIEYDSEDYWECMLRHFARRGDHQMGTCRMGSVNDPSSVVDPRLRMFLGESLLKISSIASLTNFLSLVLHPRPVDPPEIFETPISNTYDYIVVGAGSAGSIVATRLSEDGANVLLLEAGGTDLNDERTQIPLMWFFLKGTAMDWGYWTVPQKFSHRAMKNEVAMQS